jgi:hypothetical protein
MCTFVGLWQPVMAPLNRRSGDTLVQRVFEEIALSEYSVV